MPHSQGVGEMRLWFVVPRATSIGEYCKIVLLRSGCWAEAVWLREITPIFFLEPHGGTREVVPVPTAEDKGKFSRPIMCFTRPRVNSPARGRTSSAPSQVIACGVSVGFPVGPVVEPVRQGARFVRLVGGTQTRLNSR